jgi:hypothetical protein
MSGAMWTLFLPLGKQHVQLQTCEPSTEPIEDHPPPLQQDVQLVQITKAKEENEEYVINNQPPKEPPFIKVNLSTSFVLVGVTELGQECHHVFEGLLLSKGLILLSGLLTNGLIQEQFYCRKSALPTGY